jgi:GPH family glycoside/pentoside/hexuronide:cation symporter
MKAGYAAGIFGISASTTTTGLLLLFCYTDVFGIAPAAAGFVIFLGTSADIVGSLLVPWLTSRCRSRLGRYRPFLIWGGIPLGVFLAALFIKPDLPHAWLYPYVIVIHLLYRASYALVLMPHASLISRLSDDADERASIGSVKAIGSNLAMLVVAAFGMSFVERLKGNDAIHGFSIFGILFGLLVAAAVITSGVSTRERVKIISPLEDTSAILRALSLMARNRQLVIAFLSTIVFFVGYVFVNGGIVYYFKYVIGNQAGAKYAALGISLGGILFPPLWAMLVHKTSKAMVWAAGCLSLAGAFVLLYFAGPQPLPILFLLYVIAGAGKCAVIMNYFAIIADAIDYGHWRQGARVEAYSFGFLALMTKIGESSGAALLGVLLGWTGFGANQTPSPETVERLRAVTCLGAVAVLIVSAGIMLLFRVNANVHREALDGIHRQRGFSSGEPTVLRKSSDRPEKLGAGADLAGSVAFSSSRSSR